MQGKSLMKLKHILEEANKRTTTLKSRHPRVPDKKGLFVVLRPPVYTLNAPTPWERTQSY